MTRVTAAVVVIVLCLLVGGLVFGLLEPFGSHTGAETPHALDQQP